MEKYTKGYVVSSEVHYGEQRLRTSTVLAAVSVGAAIHKFMESFPGGFNTGVEFVQLKVVELKKP
jgi:ABC-type transport system involved in Fe-S cluster assembly fused permease/ATPase subunit